MIKLTDIIESHVVWSTCRYIAQEPGATRSDLEFHLSDIYKHGVKVNFNWINKPDTMVVGKLTGHTCNLTHFVDNRGIGIFEWQKGRVNGRKQGYYILPLGEQFAQEPEPRFDFVKPKPMPTAWLENHSEGMLLTSRRRTGGVFLYDPRNFSKMTYLMPSEIVTLVSVDEVGHLNDEATHRKYGREYISAKVVILHPMKGLFEVDPSGVRPVVKKR